MGALVGFVLGALIGNLFGHRKVRNPESWGTVTLQTPNAHYELGATQATNGDSLDLVKAMALTARNTLNGLIDSIAYAGSPAYVSNLNGQATNQTYGHIYNGNTGLQKVFVTINGVETDFEGVNGTPDKAVDLGVLTAIRNTKIIGGDIFAKRAILRSTATDLTSLAGDLKIADDYKFFTQNRDLIQQSITGAYALSSAGGILLQSDKDYYNNPAAGYYQKWLVDTVDTKGVGALTGTDLTNYNNANAGGMINRLVQSLQNQAIANPWIITLQRAKELRLDSFAPSDFYGGLKGFLDSFLPFKTDVHYEDMEFSYNNGFALGALGGTNVARTTTDVNSQAAQVYRLYNLMFGRAPSYGEYEGWISELENGIPLETVAGWFMPYASWTTTASNSDFMAAVYQHAFGRAALQSEIDSWVGNISRGESRGQVLAFFSEYADHRARTDTAISSGISYADGRGVGLFSSLTTATPDGRLVSLSLDASIGYTQYAGGNLTSGADFFVPANYLAAQSVSDQGGGDDIIIGGEAVDTLQGGPGWDWINGKGGNDTLYGQDGNDVIVGGAGEDRILGGAGDDYISGGDGQDWSANAAAGGLFGEDGNDTLTGGAGPDALIGGNGDDTFIIDEDGGNVYDHIEGGAGSDTASYERFSIAVGIDLRYANQPQGSGYGAGWVYIYGDELSVENVTGTNFEDVLVGDDGANVLRGGAGNDYLNGWNGDNTLEGGAGADLLAAGGGMDIASYEHSAAGVYVDLSTGTAYGGEAEGDTFSGVDSLRGSRFSDELKGASWNSRVDGGAGDDVLDFSGGGDAFIGGDGFDTVDYSAATSPYTDANGTQGIYVDLTGARGYSFGGRVAQGDTYSSVEQIVGTQWSDEIYGTAADEVFDGRAGNDFLAGGGGSDTYVFGRDYGTDVVQDDNSSANAVRLIDGVKFSDLYFGTQGSASGWLEIGIFGSSALIHINGNFGPYPIASKNIVKTLDDNGAGQLDVGALSFGIGGTGNGDALRGASSNYNLIAGYAGADSIYGSSAGAGTVWSNKGSVIIGGTGDDIIYTSAGDDQFAFDKGDGHDTLYVDGGDDTIVFGSSVAASDVFTQVVGDDLYIAVKNDPSALNPDATQQSNWIRVIAGGTVYENLDTGATTFITITHINVGGTSLDLTQLNLAWNYKTYRNPPSGGGGGGGGGGHPAIPPLVFDLGGDGLDLTSVDDSEVVTQSAAGVVTRLSWVGPTDGILALDRDGDGAINHTAEISFYQDKAGAETDLQGLAAYDSNADGVLNASDTDWGRFLIWTDHNQNGRSTASELQGLTAAGISSIDLHGKPTGFNGSDTTDSYVTNTTSFGKADGTSGTAYDVALARRFLGAQGFETPTGTTWSDAAADATLGLMPGAASASFGDGANTSTASIDDLAAASSDETIVAAARKPKVTIDFSDNDVLNATSAARWGDKIDPAKKARRAADDSKGMRPPSDLVPKKDAKSVVAPPAGAAARTSATISQDDATSSAVSGSAASDSFGGVGAVSATRGSGEGPLDVTLAVPASTFSPDSLARWWSDQGSVGGLSGKPDGLAGLRPAGLQTVRGASVGADAAAMQRQQLLRQSMAAFTGASTGAAAPIWRRSDDPGAAMMAAPTGGARAAALPAPVLHG